MAEGRYGNYKLVVNVASPCQGLEYIERAKSVMHDKALHLFMTNNGMSH